MAVVPWTIDEPASGEQFPTGTRVIKWALASGDTGTPYKAAHNTDKSVQVTGTAGAGTTVRMEGSNAVADAPAWGILTDPQGVDATWNDAQITASEFRQMLENSWQIRPNYTAGTATAVVVRMLITTMARR